ncbi:MAG TPA: carboxypeptidase-like regulatory domain-containing protein, partial [Paludibacteraceae bacterium]|nr:carboxypeptidase-like regulatory domain-containing protein [Paludibacteraceae bacterium]
MKKNLLLFIFILLGTIGETSAKTIHISGKVTDGKGVAMEFVNISVKGTSQGCRTDSAGRFEFEPTTEK